MKDSDLPEMDLAVVVRLWWRHRRIILLSVFSFLLLGVAAALLIPKSYTVTVKFVAESTRKGLGSDLSGLTSLVGLDLASLRTEENLSPDVYPAIVTSAPFLSELAGIGVKGRLLPEYIPGAKRNPGSPGEPEKWLRYMRDKLNVYTDRKSGLTEISVTLSDPLAAAVAADSLTARLERYLIASRTRKARQDFLFVSDRFEEARSRYHTAQEAYARFSDSHRHTQRESAAIDRNRLYNEQQLAHAVYTQLAAQLETARIRVQEETPVFTVIEPAAVPARHSHPRRSLIVLLFLLAGAALPMTILTVKFLLKPSP